MCVFRHRHWVQEGNSRVLLLSGKRLRWYTNMGPLAEKLRPLQCPGGHTHYTEGQVSERISERHPARLVKLILGEVLSAARRQRGIPAHALEIGIGPHVDDDPDPPSFAMEVLKGKTFRDIYTGIELEPERVMEARMSELRFADEL